MPPTRSSRRTSALLPDDAAGHVNLGIAYFNERDFDKARQIALLRAGELDEATIRTCTTTWASSTSSRGESEAAVAAFERVAADRPADDSMTHYYLGTLYATLGRLEDAETQP